jgi:hypothetical protein
MIGARILYKLLKKEELNAALESLNGEQKDSKAI